MFHPDFETSCTQCGSSPCVVIEGHLCPDTGLCGVCFFSDRMMIDWELWDEVPEDTE